MKKIALYVRVSTEEQASIQEGSLKSQEQRLREFVETRNAQTTWGTVVGVFIERGKSGKDTNRPELQKLIFGIQQKRYNLVIVTELSRLSRSTRDFCNMMDLFKKNDCKILSLREQFDTTTAAGEMMLHMMINFAQFERQQTSERIKANFQARFRRGLYNGGFTPLGYVSDLNNKGRLLIVEEEAHVIRECFKTFLEKGSLGAAVKDLNQRGLSPRKIKTASDKKYLRRAFFTTDALLGILKNSVYIAKRTLSEDEKTKIITCQWEPILNEETFNKANETLKANRYKYKPDGRKKYPYVLSGLIFCGECNGRLVGKTAHGNTKKSFYYDHGMTLKVNYWTNQPGCRCQVKRVKAPMLEKEILKYIRDQLTTKEVMNGVIQQAQNSKEENNLEEMILEQKRQIKNAGKSVESLLDHLERLPTGIKAKSLYERISYLESQKEKLEAHLNVLETAQLAKADVVEPQAYLNFLNAFVAQIDEAPDVLKKRLLQSLIHKIIVRPQDVEVFLHAGKYVVDSVHGDKNGEIATSVFAKASTRLAMTGGHDNITANKKNLLEGSNTVDSGGPEEDRNPNLCIANAALSQLSYRPMK